MSKNKRYFIIMAIIGLGIGLFLSVLNHRLIFADETGYRDYDKHKAVSTCMEKIYLERYQTEPAQEDVFHLCEQRYRELSHTLSHTDFLKAKNETPVLGADGSFAPNIYYDTLFGRLRSSELPNANSSELPNAH